MTGPRSSPIPSTLAIVPGSQATRKLCPGTNFQRRGPEVGFEETSPHRRGSVYISRRSPSDGLPTPNPLR